MILLVDKLKQNYLLVTIPEDAGEMIPKLPSNQGRHRFSYFQTALSRYSYKLFLKHLNSVSTANKDILVQHFILSHSPQYFHRDVQSLNDGLYLSVFLVSAQVVLRKIMQKGEEEIEPGI